MPRIIWLVASLCLALPGWSAAGEGIADVTVRCDRGGLRCDQIFAEIELSNGIAGELKLSFEQASRLTTSSLDLSAVLVDPRDPELGSRLPKGTYIPKRFPVLFRIEPSAKSDLSFRGRWRLEVHTENLEYSPHTPLRLFHASEKGRFLDISESLGYGSFRVLGAGGQFSEFLIVADMRPVDAVIADKFDRVESALQEHAEWMPNVLDDLNDFLAQARQDLEAGKLEEALSGIDALIRFVEQQSDTEIPDTWEPSGQPGVAGLLRAAGGTLWHSLHLKQQTASLGTGALSADLEVSGGHRIRVKASFEEAFELDPQAVDIAAELIDVNDPALLARLPAGVQIPAEFPVLIRITPNTDEELAFSGMMEIELTTDGLDFVADSPLRLFRAPDMGSFEDITLSLGLGSFRVLGAGGQFSEFLIASDLRPVTTVIEEKFDRIEDILKAHAGVVSPAVFEELNQRLAQVRQSHGQGLTDQAVAEIEAWQDAVKQHSGEDIPGVWRSDGQGANAAGKLGALARSLRFSLDLERTPVQAEAGDVNRDGKVDLADVFHLIHLIFGDAP